MKGIIRRIREFLDVIPSFDQSRMERLREAMRESGYEEMNPDEFVERMLECAKPTRELILQEGDPGPVPVTKLSGVPWWPESAPRPKCGKGHPMVFVVQVYLPDVPGLDHLKDCLYSFHYCRRCTFEGNMSHDSLEGDSLCRHDISIFEKVAEGRVDGLGLMDKPILEPQAVTFRDIDEVPDSEGVPEDVDRRSPLDFPQGKDDFDEDIYPGLKHVYRSKLGGWPSWVQNPERPKGEVDFICQLDWGLGMTTPWCSGGYLYLFLRHNGGFSGDFVIQTT